MDKLLKIYTYVDGVNDTPFPNADAQIEIFSFNYNAKRMGGAPTISTSVMYKDCLDKLWTGKEYVIYNGERYKLKQIPTSSKSNTDARYKHDLELVALRVVLDYVYFFDAVVENTPVDDKPVTNSTRVIFSGDIHEFAKRLNASLKYTKLDYSVVVDKGITSETKFLEFTDQPISSVLQEIYKQYEIPYYFVGNVIHIGFTSNAITTPFKYGVNDALLSISKNNANNKIVNRCTGVGSSENIPYYYPNEHPLGEVDAYYNSAKDNSLIVDKEAFAKEVKLATELTFKSVEKTEIIEEDYIYSRMNFIEFTRTDTYSWLVMKGDFLPTSHLWAREMGWILAPCFFNEDSAAYYAETETWDKGADIQYANYKYINPITNPLFLSFYGDSVDLDEPSAQVILNKIDRKTYAGKVITPNFELDTEEDIRVTIRYAILYYNNREQVDYKIVDKVVVDEMIDDYLFCIIQPVGGTGEHSGKTKYAYYNLKLVLDTPLTTYNWYNEKGAIANLKDYGLAYSGTPDVGDKIEFKQVEGSLIPFQDTLMPPIYTKSKGAESFYNALNNTYISPETGSYYEFDNEYSAENRREHKETFDYIKPSIEFVRNGNSMPINMFLDFAYDKKDSDEIDETTNEYIHPYFYAKLRKFNGEFGFNLFDHANEKGEMTISMTSGDCGACQFVVGVEENTKKNIVQVDENGDLVRDEYGNVKRTGEPQDRQNDTINNEVWIALKKDIQTFGTLLPNKGIKPKACTSQYADDGDTIVITNISLPKAYIQNAEERLKEEIIKYMKLNNSEKFTFSIKFSRIYLADNPNIFAQLNENARIKIEYNGVPYELYVSSYQYKVVGNEVLPEITVELADSLSTNENAIQKAISAVEHSIMSSVGSIDFYKQGLRYFIRKDVEDWARGLIHLTKGATFGADDIAKIDEQGNAEFVSQIVRQFITTPRFIDGFAGEGFKLWLDENGRSNLTVDNLTAREAFRVFELVVTKLRAVNGGLFVSAANGTIREVSESEDGQYFIITFEQESAFIAGDYMRCQVMSGNILANWWVEVAQVDNGRVWVAKSEFEGAMPLAGQEVVLDGSKNVGRQNAIHISASDDGKPRIDILNGISTKDHANCLRTRLGDLRDMEDTVFGAGVIQGDGLYSDNAYLKGEFILKNTGENIETKFEITDDSIKSAVGTLQNDMEFGKTILYNPSFTKGEDGWITSNVVIYYLLGDTPVYNNGRVVYNNAHDDTDPDYSNHRFILNITNGSIKQLNEYFVNKPDISATNLVPISLNLKVMVEDEGYLLAYLDECNIDKERATSFSGTSVANYAVDGSLSVLVGNGKAYTFAGITSEILQGDDIAVETKGDVKLINLTQKCAIQYSSISEEQGESYETLDKAIVILGCEHYTASNDYLALEFISYWNGSGNFNLAFSGGASVYSIQLFTNPTEVRHATLFEQTDRLLSLTAAIYDKDQEKLKESGLVIMPESAGLFTKDENGNVATIGTYEGGVVKLSGSEIRLEGDVSVNGKVRIDEETKTLYAEDGVFSGTIEGGKGLVMFNENANCKLALLPTTPEILMQLPVTVNDEDLAPSEDVYNAMRIYSWIDYDSMTVKPVIDLANNRWEEIVRINDEGLFFMEEETSISAYYTDGGIVFNLRNVTGTEYGAEYNRDGIRLSRILEDGTIASGYIRINEEGKIVFD